MSFPQTPMRAVPGAFLNTPAMTSRFQPNSDPTRRQLFPPSENSGASASSSKSAPVAATPTASGGAGGLVATNPLPPPRAETVPPVIKAARALNEFLQSDENFPDLDSYIRRKSTFDVDHCHKQVLILPQRESRPTMSSPAPTLPPHPSTRRTCSLYPTRSLIIIMSASYRL